MKFWLLSRWHTKADGLHVFDHVLLAEENCPVLHCVFMYRIVFAHYGCPALGSIHCADAVASTCGNQFLFSECVCVCVCVFVVAVRLNVAL